MNNHKLICERVIDGACYCYFADGSVEYSDLPTIPKDCEQVHFTDGDFLQQLFNF